MQLEAKLDNLTPSVPFILNFEANSSSGQKLTLLYLLRNQNFKQATKI